MLRAFVALAIVGLLGLWYWLESDATAARLRGWLERGIADAIGSPALIADIELDVLPFHLALTDVQLGEQGALARAERLVIDVSPWGMFRQRIIVTNLELDRPRVDLTAFEWAPAGGDGSAVQFDVLRLAIRGGELRFGGTTAAIDGELVGIGLEMAPESQPSLRPGPGNRSGELRIGGGHLRLTRSDGAGAQLEPLELRAIFGVRRSIVEIADLRLSAGTSTLSATGTIRGTANADLRLQAEVAVADMFRAWLPPGPNDHGGRAEFRGDLQMRNGSPFLSGRLRATDARMSGVPLDRAALDLAVTPDAVLLHSVSLDLYGGQIEGSFEFDRSVTPPRIEIVYDANDLDTSALTHWTALPGWRLAGHVSGSGRIGWAGPFAATANGEGQLRLQVPDARSALATHEHVDLEAAAPHELRATHLVPSLPVPARASVGYRIADGVLTLDEARLGLPGSTIRAGGQVDLDGPLQLAARIETSDLRQLDHIVAQYRSFRGGLASETRLGVRGSASAELRIGGTMAAPAVSGSLIATDLSAGDLAIGDLGATLTTSADGRLQARPLRITGPGGNATGSASISIPASGYGPDPASYTVRLRLDGYRFESGLDLARHRLVRGILDGELTLAGSVGAIDEATIDLTARTPRIGTLALDSLAVAGIRQGDTWTLESLSTTGLGGSAQARGQLTSSGELSDVTARVASIDLAPLTDLLGGSTALSGSLDLTVRLDGPLQAIDGLGELAWSDAAIANVRLGNVAVAARADGGVLAARGVGDLSGARPEAPLAPRPTALGSAPASPITPAGGWSAGVSATLGEPALVALRLAADLGGVGGALELLEASLPAGLDLSGQLELEGHGFVGDLGSWNGSARLERALLVRDATAAAVRAEATVASGILETSARVESGQGSLDITGQLDLANRTTSTDIRGTLDLLAFRLWSREFLAEGIASADLRISGALRRPSFDGTVRSSEIRLDTGIGYPITGASAELELSGNRIVLESASGLVAGSPFRASGSIRMGASTPETAPARLQLQLDALPLRPLLERSDAVIRLVNTGTLRASLDLLGGSDPESWSGDVRFEEMTLRMRDYRLDLDRAVEARLERGAITFPDTTKLTGARTALRLGGRVELFPLALDLSARGPLGFEPLNVLSPYWGTGGVADLDLRILGTAPDLAYRGTAELRDVVLSPPPLRQPFEQLRAHLVFEDRRVGIEGVEGSLGGGRVTAGGEMFLRDSLPQSFRIALNVENALIRVERDVRVEASAALVHDGTPERSLLSGTIQLAEGIYRRNVEADDALLDMLEVPETDPNPVLTSIQLDVQVEGSSNLFVDNNLADVEITADFDLRGSLAKPVALGRSRLLGGRLYWNGNTFEVLQGVVEFNNPFETEPVFEIRARTEIRRYTIDLNFSGSLTRGVAFDYTSTPPMSDLDLFNLLAFGEEPDSSVLQDPYRYQTALGLQASRYLADAYLTEVERGAERLFGIDRFRISPTLSGSETDATARMTLGKRINRNLYMVYSRLLSSSEDQLVTVEYQLTPELRIKGTRDEDGSFGIDFLVQTRIR